LAVFATAILILAGEVVLLDAATTGLGLLRPLVTTPVLLLVPGTLVLALVGVDINSPERLVYAVLISVVSLMALGLLMNVLGRRLSFPTSQPFRQAAMILAVFLLVLGLVAAVRLRRPSVELPAFEPRTLDPRVLGLSLSVLCLSVAGATALKWTGQNLFLLAFFLIIAMSAVVVTRLDASPTTQRTFLWCVSLALLLQKTLVTYYQHTGDGPKEYYFANLVVANGVWNPTYGLPKNGMLSLVVYYPINAVVSGLELILVFKIVYPLLFAFVSVALYELYRKQVSDNYAFLATLLVLFLHTYFVTLAASTRTGIGLLFAVGLLLVNVDGTLSRRQQVVLSILTGAGLVVSYYAVAILFFGMLGLVVLGNYIVPLVTEIKRSPAPIASLTFGGLFGVTLGTWYIYTASSSIVVGIVTILSSMLARLGNIFKYSAAGHAVDGGPQSFTSLFIKFEFLVLTVLIAVGGLVAANHVLRDTLARYRLTRSPSRLLSSVDHENTSVSLVYLLFAGGAVSLLVMAFAPGSPIGIGRIYMIAILFLSPIAVLGATTVFELLGQFRPPTHTNASILAGVLGIALVVNSGVFAATVTHDSSPQPQLDQQGEQLTVKDLSIYHKYHYYYNVQAAGWILEHRNSAHSIYGPGFREVLPTYYFYGSIDSTGVKPPGNYRRLPKDSIRKPVSGYVFVGGFSNETGKTIIKRGRSSTDYIKYVLIDTSRLRMA